MQAQKSLSSISENRSVWIAQYRQEMFERDRISGLGAARNDGRKEQAFATVRSMLADGMPLEKIVQYMGLSVEDIRAQEPIPVTMA